MTQIATKKGIPPAANNLGNNQSIELKEDMECSLAEAIILTDARFIIQGFNDIATAVYGLNPLTARGESLFNLVDFELINTAISDAIRQLFATGFWKGVIIYQYCGKKYMLNTRCNLVKDDTELPMSIVISSNRVAGGLQPLRGPVITGNSYQTLVETLSEGVMLINANGNIEASNKKACEILGLLETEMIGNKLASQNWRSIKEDGTEFLRDDFPAMITLQSGKECINVVVGLVYKNGERKIWLSINSRPVFNTTSKQPVAAVVSFTEITTIKKINEQLSASEALFRNFMKDSPTLGWIYDEDGELLYGNPRFMDVIGITPGPAVNDISTFAKSKQVLATIFKRNSEVLDKGKTIIIEESLAGNNGVTRYFLSYWFILPQRSNKRLIGGHAVEITDKKRAQAETDKMHERYLFALNAGSDAIWDMDVATGFIFRSDTFAAFSGYPKSEIAPTLEWFFQKIHTLDRKRVQENIEHCLKNNITAWEHEYQFRVADGSYRHLLDKAHAIMEDGKLVRVIGAMQDTTERKNMAAQLLREQVQKQKLISQATITAQEKERNRISGELHDNVNQLLMTAKLHVCVAKNKGGEQAELLGKANEYLLMALAEIRELSKGLTSIVLTKVGLQKSIADIANNMLLLKQIHLHIFIRDEVVTKLSPEQQLMVYRIIQEQSNNIIKYAETQEAVISLKEVNHQVELIISDNGKGFDKEGRPPNGIGFINIFNRVDAYNGRVDIITSPGNGCSLIINFPINDTTITPTI